MSDHASIDSRHAAPVPRAAWRELEDTARAVLAENCSARRVCDRIGPLGLDVAAVNTGTIDAVETDDPALIWGLRESRPLLELRAPFSVSLAQVLHVAHGARDIDWTALEQAARRYARFEDRTIYHGLPQAGLGGIRSGLSLAPRPSAVAADALLDAIAAARCDLIEADMGDDHAMVVDPVGHRLLGGVHAGSGRPLRTMVEELIGGPVLRSPILEHPLLLALGPDRFELTIGQDVCLRFVELDGDRLDLSFLGTFGFRLLEDRAGVAIEWT